MSDLLISLHHLIRQGSQLALDSIVLNSRLDLRGRLNDDAAVADERRQQYAKYEDEPAWVHELLEMARR
jgi:hypothetical protein